MNPSVLIKQNNQISLAPIYNFALMKADPERVTRTFTWGDGIERGGSMTSTLLQSI
jgi:serine/threonine-protein kinase HipA